MSLKYCNNRLFLIKVKWLMIKRKKDCLNFGPVFNAKSTIPSHLVFKYCQKKNQILILIWIIYKKEINSYLVTILKLFIVLFYVYQHLFLAFVDLAKINFNYVFPNLTLTIILFLIQNII